LPSTRPALALGADTRHAGFVRLEDDEYDDPADAEADRRVLGWGGSANPNTVDGELQNMSAFAQAAINASGWRRLAARAGAWLALGLIAGYLLVVLVASIRGH
jgi:hypothetical protein